MGAEATITPLREILSHTAVVGYALCAVSYLVVSLIFKAGWRGHRPGQVLLLTSVASILWAITSGFGAYQETYYAPLQQGGELLRNGMWIAFLTLLLKIRDSRAALGKPSWTVVVIAMFCAVLIIAAPGLGVISEDMPDGLVQFVMQTYGFMGMSLAALILIEQLFRNTPVNERWSIKFLCFGVGGLFAFDFYLYSDALLMREIDQDIWAARGYVNTMIVPLIAISATRNPQWTLDVHFSQKFVFHTATLIGAGIYLAAMAAGGYYIRLYGGSWGSIAQTIFLFGALVLLGVLLFSGYMRAKLKLFLAKNFFNYKYDYRVEWLRLIKTMSEARSSVQIRTSAVSAIADIVESPGGLLWLRDVGECYRVSVNWNAGMVFEPEPAGSPLIRFLRGKDWVIELDELHNVPELYEDLAMPSWIAQVAQAWLILPLMHQTELLGFIVLTRPRAAYKINWEDRDLLLTASRQMASYLALLQANEALFNARQFEAFNRLSAYVVHDLKNLVAQLSLVVSNAEKHKRNPAFMEDAITTVENAMRKMNKMLGQLRKGPAVLGERSPVSLQKLLTEVVEKRAVQLPRPKLQGGEDLMILADADRLVAVMEHLIQNAQEATAPGGEVWVKQHRQSTTAVVEIADSGHGMDEDFIKNRLFKPFETTKGNAGMGIGVYESREYVYAIGGSMMVQSQPGVGTTFIIQLPLMTAAEPQTAEAQYTGKIA